MRILLLIGFILCIACNKANTHECPFEFCPFKTFPYKCICPKGSDCDHLDAIHLKYPTFSYDQCDSIYSLTKF